MTHDAGVTVAGDPAFTVRLATPADADAIAQIYNHYVRETIVTFEEEAVTPAEMARRFQETKSASLPWLVAEHDGRILGFAYASEWKGRCAYRFSAEVTVYVDVEHAGRPGLVAGLVRQPHGLARPRHERVGRRQHEVADDERRRLPSAENLTLEHPLLHQIANVLPRDLVEGRVALARIGAGVGQPVMRFLVGTKQAFFMSHDGGATWSRRGGNVPFGDFTSILVNPRNGYEIFVGNAYQTSEIGGGADPEEAIERAVAGLKQAGFGPVDYLAYVDGDSLEPLDRYREGGRLIAAAFLGGVRLIDNISVISDTV